MHVFVFVYVYVYDVYVYDIYIHTLIFPYISMYSVVAVLLVLRIVGGPAPWPRCIDPKKRLRPSKRVAAADWLVLGIFK